MRIALDTNVLVYAEGLDGQSKQRQTLHILDSIPRDLFVVPAQSLGEFFYVLVRKGGYTPGEARDLVLGWRDSVAIADTTSDVLLSAADLAVRHQLTIWDSIILSASSSAGCRLLLSEDLQDGFTWCGVTVANPFAAKLNPLLEALLH